MGLIMLTSQAVMDSHMEKYRKPSATPQCLATAPLKRKESMQTAFLLASHLPAMCSCLGQIPLDDVDKQSSSSGVTWMPTSTGLDAFFISIGEGEGGLSTAFSKQRLPLHCFRLCSIKIRMSPNGKFIWHCPHVRRSWSPSGAPKGPWSGSSSVRMASRGSAVVGETKAQLLGGSERREWREIHYQPHPIPPLCTVFLGSSL